MPADTNPAGDIFGGWLMAQMDLAAGNVAARRARGRCATVAVDSFTFHQPVKVGDEVSVFARILREGRSSMHLHVEAWRRLARGRGTPQGHAGDLCLCGAGRGGPAAALPQARHGQGLRGAALVARPMASTRLVPCDPSNKSVAICRGARLL
jgi:acyl-CoA hydrolase